MKTTLDIEDRLVARAKALAIREKTTLTRLVEEGLSLRLRRNAAVAEALPSLPVVRGKGGLRSGVDPLSNRSLREAAGEDV